MSLYEKFMQWTSRRSRTDIWRAFAGILVVALVLFLLTGCYGPSMTLASSNHGDGFIQVSQPIYQSSGCKPKHEVFVDYLHHSEIFKERDEDVYDGARLGYTHNFDNWVWQK